MSQAGESIKEPNSASRLTCRSSLIADVARSKSGWLSLARGRPHIRTEPALPPVPCNGRSLGLYHSLWPARWSRRRSILYQYAFSTHATQKYDLSAFPRMPKPRSLARAGDHASTASCTESAAAGKPPKKPKRARRLCGADACLSGAVGGGALGRCTRHGGGRRCAVDGCESGAKGTTGLCTRHGGERRCPPVVPGPRLRRRIKKHRAVAKPLLHVTFR